MLLLTKTRITTSALLYIGTTSFGFILLLTGGTLVSRVIQVQFKNRDIFNKENETFPQEERLLENDFSLNFPGRYNLKGKSHKSWINIINPFRALLVLGSPGAGKSYFVIRHVIISKSFFCLIPVFQYLGS